MDKLDIFFLHLEVKKENNKTHKTETNNRIIDLQNEAPNWFGNS